MTERSEAPGPSAAVEADFFGAADVAEREQRFADIFARAPTDRRLARIFAGLVVGVVALLGVARLRGPATAEDPPGEPEVAKPVTVAKPAAAPKPEVAKPAAAPKPEVAKPTEAPVAAAKPAEAPPAVAPGPATLPDIGGLESPGLSRKLQALAAEPPELIRARAALAAADYAGAARLLEALPHGPVVDAALGRAYFELGRDDDALAALQRARTADPAQPEALIVLGSLLQNRRDVDGARAAYRAYLDHHPDGPEAAEVRLILARL
jgi:tetratricopeptide (TPR) repeat protein